MPELTFEDKLLQFVEELCRRDGYGAELQPDTPLFSGGLIDSRRVVDLMEFVERELALTIPDRLLSTEHFASVRRIARTFTDPQRDGAAPAAAQAPLLQFGAPSSRPAGGAGVQALLDRGDIRAGADGCVSFSGQALALHSWFSARFASLARVEAAAPRRYPTLLPVADMDRTDYFTSFPQHATFCTCLAPDPATLRGFVGDLKHGRSATWAAEPRVEAPSHMLSSAVCYHCFRELAGRTLASPPGELTVLTAEGRCFRHERGAFRRIDRCYEFTMREIVCLGEAGEIEQRRMRLMQRVVDLAEALGLSGTVERATDLFYGDAVEGRARALHQRATALKYELRARLDEAGSTLAIASFNLHEDYFGRAFGIRMADGGTASSGCVAFGIERWVSAFLAHHGADPAAWPPAVREAVAAHG